MKSEIRIENSAELCRIEIEGTIGVPETRQFDEPEARVATYEKFRGALRRIAAIEAAEVVVDIRSTGGDVNDALLIHDALCGLQARITTRCYGYTASAATIIAQAASEGRREISAHALYLIHSASCSAEGNAAEMAGTLDLLRRTDERIAGVYAARSGRSAAEFAALMAENNGAGRWLSPAETIAAGLADRIVDADPDAAAGAVADEAPAAEAAPRADAAVGAAVCRSSSAPGALSKLVRGWERLLARMRLFAEGVSAPVAADEAASGGKPASGAREPSPASAAAGSGHAENGDSQTQLRHVSVAAEAARSRALPTAVRACEDPSPDGNTLTSNQRAYAEDARRFRKP